MERQFIEWLEQRFAASDLVDVGIGDDCAVLKRPDSQIVLTTDSICEGVHFNSEELSAREIGRKALAVNLSDLASMGAKATVALVSLTLPRSNNLRFAKELIEGMVPLAEEFSTSICGGDTNVWNQGLVVSITAIGEAPKSGVWRNNGAKPGDHIVVTGEFGGSILRHHWAFQPRLDFANYWRDCPNGIHACTDASDSLGVDLAQIAKSSGVGFELDMERIPIAEDAFRRARQTGHEPLHHALTDGEDFQLLMAVSPEFSKRLESESPCPVKAVGQFIEDPIFYSIDNSISNGNGRRSKFKESGYEH